MRVRISGTALAVAAVITAAALGAGAGNPALASPAAPTGQAAAAASRAQAAATATAAAAPGQTASTVLLIDGTQLLMHSAQGGGAVSVLPGSPRGGLVSQHSGGVIEEIPSDVAPYLGHGLDPSLFNVMDLQRAESGGRLPVQVTFSGARPDLPGVTLTASGAGSASGYVTASGARTFGAALAAQAAAERASGRPAAGGLLASTTIALAGAPEPTSPVRPDYPMHTLTIDGTDAAGKPDNGDGVSVYDGSSLTAFGDPMETFATFYDGVAKFSVPTGDYWVIAGFSGSDSTREDILPEVAVNADITVHVAASAATSQVTVATPRPAVSRLVELDTVVTDPQGLTASVGQAQQGGTLYVSPMTARPPAGTLQAYVYATLSPAPTGGSTPYGYNLDIPESPDVIPAQQKLTLQPANLASVTEHYYQDVTTAGAWAANGLFPSQWGAALDVPLTLPATQVQYFNTAPGLAWQGSYISEYDATQHSEAGGVLDAAYRFLSPGPQAVSWNEYPLHPQPDFSAGSYAHGLGALIPSAARVGNTLELYVTPFSDNVPGHEWLGPDNGGSVSGTYDVDQNGTLLSSGGADGLIPFATLSPDPSTVSFTLKQALSDPTARLSTATTTTWTWKSAPDPTATVPGPIWACSTPDDQNNTQQCAVQPMMTLGYQVRGLSLTGAAPAGAQHISLHAGHIQLANAASITGATAQVSCDDGTTWAKAAVTSAGGGNFTVSFTEKSGCLVTTKVTATDSTGGSVTETITRAYQVG